jgi:hypothetical protein
MLPARIFPKRQEDPVFERFMGVPAHPLLIHAAVVFIPLLALAALAFGLVPGLRTRIWWAAALLAVAAPGAAFLSMESGSALADILKAKGFAPEILNQVETHQGYGDVTFWLALALGLVVLVQVYLAGQFPRVPAPAGVPAVASIALAVASGVLAVITGYYVYKTGDTGAKAVWTGV